MSQHLESCGFSRGRSNLSFFYNVEQRLKCLVHGDDYATVGSLDSLAGMKARFAGEFDMKTTIVGHSGGADVVSEGQILNITIRATSAGWEYECDQRHVEVLIEELEPAALRPVTTPGVAEAVDKSQVGAVIVDEDPDSVPPGFGCQLQLLCC